LGLLASLAQCCRWGAWNAGISSKLGWDSCILELAVLAISATLESHGVRGLEAFLWHNLCLRDRRYGLSIVVNS